MQSTQTAHLRFLNYQHFSFEAKQIVNNYFQDVFIESNHNDDLDCVDLHNHDKSKRIQFRTLKAKYGVNYFTIRNTTQCGSPTEWNKIFLPTGPQYFLIMFKNDMEEIINWKLIDLQVFKDFYDCGLVKSELKYNNYKDKTDKSSYYKLEIVEKFVVAKKEMV